MAKSESAGSVLLAPSPSGAKVYDLMYYIKGAAAGGVCCSITHGALCPVDVVKTRVQLDPVKVCLLLYNTPAHPVWLNKYFINSIEQDFNIGVH
jgi:hypothetical protein